MIKLDKSKPFFGFPETILKQKFTMFAGQRGVNENRLLRELYLQDTDCDCGWYDKTSNVNECIKHVFDYTPLDDEPPYRMYVDGFGEYTHPVQQKQLVKLFRDNNVQVIGTIYAPYLADELTVDELWLLHRVNSDCVVAAQLSEWLEYSTWFEEMTIGEMWSLAGEGWIEKLLK